MNVQLPDAASLQRTDAVCEQIDAILKTTDGVQTYNTVVGFSLLSGVDDHLQRLLLRHPGAMGGARPGGPTAAVIMRELNQRLCQPARGAGVRLRAAGDSRRRHVGRRHLHARGPRRQGRRVPGQEHRQRFLAAARQRPEFATVWTTFIPGVPQMFANVDRDKVLKQGVDLSAVYKTLQAFMGGAFVNYFNRFGFVWQVYVQAEGDVAHAGRATSGGSTCATARANRCHCRRWSTCETPTGPSSPCTTTATTPPRSTPPRRPATAPDRAWRRSRRSSPQTSRARWASTTSGMSYQEQVAAQGVPPSVIFAFSLLVVFLILAAQYESWTLPFSVLLGVPIAVFGAFAALWLRGYRQQRLRPDRPGDADRPGGQERHPDRRVRQGRARERQVARRRRAGRRAAAAARRS